MPRSFLITNRRYRRQVAAEDCASAGSESAEFDQKMDDDRFSNSTGSSELDLISEPSNDSCLKDVANEGAVVSGNATFAVFSDLPLGGSRPASTTLDFPSSYEALFASRGDKIPIILFPDLINYLGTTKKSSDDVVPKDVYYKLDDSLNELVERTSWNGSPPPIDALDLHVCPDCGKQYSTSSNLARHRQTHRGPAGDRKSRKCPHCNKEYLSMPAYSMHVRTHNQGCACPHCGKRFSRPWLLQGHVRTHTGEKPFRCPQCAKTFADKSNLRAHIQTHSTEKPFVCGRCGKAFALKSYLYKHEESSCMRSSRFYDGLHQRNR